MPKKSPELKATQVAALKEPGLHAVGGVPGLALQITDSGARCWSLRATIHGKRRELGLGNYPTVTLGEAREKARQARDAIRIGQDPVEQRRLERLEAARQNAAAMTFERCALQYVEQQSPSWKNKKHAQQWTNTLAQHAYPVLGPMAVSDIDLPQVLAVLQPLWTTKTETASRLRNRLELILDWATVRGYRTGDNPARWRGHLDKLLPRPSKLKKVKHHEALDVDEIGAFMMELRALPGMGARALEFAVLNAVRSAEVRGATWSEVDLERATWTIPAARMKAGKEHRVPLSGPALALLQALPRIQGDALIFPGTKRRPDGSAIPLSDMTLTAVLRRQNVPATAHGMRSTFRDWAGDRTAHAREVIEHALAHQLKDKAEASYARGDLFTKRRELMDDWARFLSVVCRPVTRMHHQDKTDESGSSAPPSASLPPELADSSPRLGHRKITATTKTGSRS